MLPFGLTRRGWLLGLGTVVMMAAGRVLGMVELYMLAGGALALLVGAALYVRLARFTLVADRELRPPRVHAGTASRVELSVRNDAFSRSPVLSARDPFEGGRRAANFLLAPLAPGETARAAYRLPTERRGVFSLGPLELTLADPFGLASSTVEAAATTTLTVYPHVDDIEAPSLTRGRDPHAGADHPTALAAAGEDFYALREYQQGDDLRRVHWKATARLDELMIRQDEMPWQGRATVVLDLRQGAHSDQSLEIAISAAASIVAACWRRRSLVRLLASGTDSGFGGGPAHVEAVLERLARAGAVPGDHLGPLLAPLRREHNGGALAVVTTAAASTADLEAVARMRGRYGAVTLVLLERSTFDPGAPSTAVPRPVPALSSVVRVNADHPFASAWAAASASARAPGRRPAGTSTRAR